MEQTTKMKKVTKDININELLKQNPEAAEILMAYGLHCVNCHFSKEDTLESGAKIHGFNDEDVEMMVRDLNRGSENERNTESLKTSKALS